MFRSPRCTMRTIDRLPMKSCASVPTRHAETRLTHRLRLPSVHGFCLRPRQQCATPAPRSRASRDRPWALWRVAAMILAAACTGSQWLRRVQPCTPRRARREHKQASQGRATRGTRTATRESAQQATRLNHRPAVSEHALHSSAVSRGSTLGMRLRGGGCCQSKDTYDPTDLVTTRYTCASNLNAPQ